MGTYASRIGIAGGVWHAAIVLLAMADAVYTGLPSAFYAVAWLAVIAGPIVPSRRFWSPAKQLAAMAIASVVGLFAGFALFQVSATSALAAECLSFGFLSVIFAVAASLPAAVQFAMEDIGEEGCASTEPCGSVGHTTTTITAAAA
jgi:hypothetical protein